jgi:hypothetical protein
MEIDMKTPSLARRIALCVFEMTGVAIFIVLFIGYWVATP